MRYADSSASDDDLDPVMTSFPEVKSRIVQLGRTSRSVTAANLRRLKDEKRKICFRRSSCSGVEVEIWAVATMLWMNGSGFITMPDQRARSMWAVLRHLFRDVIVAMIRPNPRLGFQRQPLPSI